MKKTLLFFSTVIFTLSLAFSSQTKGQDTPSARSVQINEQKNGKTTILLKGQILKLTLGNPGDGGYAFDAPKCNSSVLKFITRTTKPPGQGAPEGDFGTDTWEFTALKRDTATLTITATRPWDKSSTMVVFKALVLIK